MRIALYMPAIRRLKGRMEKISRLIAFGLLSCIGVSCSGVLAMGSTLANTQDGKFDVESVKQNRSDDGKFKIQFTEDGFTARGVTILMLLEEAYGLFDEHRISGPGKLLNGPRYDIEAKVASSQVDSFSRLDLSRRRLLLQHLLQDRFNLKVEKETKVASAFALEIGKKGFTPQETKSDRTEGAGETTSDGFVSRKRPGLLAVEGMSLKGFSHLLAFIVAHPVIDKTGLTGRYDMTLQWSPTEQFGGTTEGSRGNPPSSDVGQSGSSIFTALREELGLRLVSIKYPMDALNIVSVTTPSPN